MSTLLSTENSPYRSCTLLLNLASNVYVNTTISIPQPKNINTWSNAYIRVYHSTAFTYIDGCILSITALTVRTPLKLYRQGNASLDSRNHAYHNDHAKIHRSKLAARKQSWSAYRQKRALRLRNFATVTSPLKCSSHIKWSSTNYSKCVAEYSTSFLF